MRLSLQAARVVSLKVGKESKDFVTFPSECGVVCEGFKDWQIGDRLTATSSQEKKPKGPT